MFDKFRNNGLKNYGLCPSHYLSTRALSWEPMPKMTNADVELISDPGMFIFFEKCLRGGVSYISNRCSKTRNKYLKSYDLKLESKRVIMQYLSFIKQADSNGLTLKGLSGINILAIV